MQCYSYFRSCLDQDTAKVPKLQSSSQAATCYYESIHLKVEAVQLSALPKDTTNELANLSSLYLFNAKRQAGKLCRPKSNAIIILLLLFSY